MKNHKSSYTHPQPNTSLHTQTLLILTLILTITIGCSWQRDPQEVQPDQETSLNPFTEFDIEVSQGAAPGYVPDETCDQCHREIFAAFMQVGMGNAFVHPRQTVFIEDFENNHYYHAPSQRHYEMIQTGDDLLFRRYELNEAGEAINLFEQQVDWILGSGYTSRSYFYQTPLGEMYQLPIAWYTQTQSWGMSPGYDNLFHDGVTRLVRRECMFCHNSYPDVPAGSDHHDQPHLYPQNLPEGLGCQRCHGPGSEHIRISLSDPLNYNPIRASIVNPAPDDTETLNNICYQCHLMPSVALAGVRRFDRDDYSFKAGEALSDYMLHVDVDVEGQGQADRFEINHHPYRLEQSECYIQSEGDMNCLTCHNPHRTIPPAQQTEHYLNICLECHQRHDYIPPSQPAARLDERGQITYVDDVNPDDCIFCHMPQRRTQDVVQVVMTDHYIRRYPPVGSEFLDPIAEHTPILTDIEFLDPHAAPADELGEVYRAVAVLRTGKTEDAADYLAEMLRLAQPTEATPYLDLTKELIEQKRYFEAEQVLRNVLTDHSRSSAAQRLLGISLLAQGRTGPALAAFQTALDINPDSIETYYNLGLLMVSQKQYRQANEWFAKAVDRRPNFTAALFYQAEMYSNLNQPDQAITFYYKALAVEPSFSRAYIALGQHLWDTGQPNQALALLQHGAKVAYEKEAVINLLNQLKQ